MRKKICIIEDNPDIREIYKTLFKKEDYYVILAENGDEGLEAIKREEPDIVLLDIMMPEKDGLELMKIMKKTKELANIPIIVLSNINDNKTVEKAGKFNPQFYLVKSLFDPKQVLRFVEEVLSQRS